jgi:hypothetical protein
MTKTFKVLASIWCGIAFGLVGLAANAGLGWIMFMTGMLAAMWKMGLLDD